MGEVLKRPALAYFGGKWRLAPRIIELIPDHKSFVDVMCGAASITIRKPRSKNEIINDIHTEIVNLFSILRDNNLELKEKLKLTPYSRDEYYLCREIVKDPIEQARRTVVKSWFGIGDSLDNETGFRVSLSQRGSTTGPWLTYVDYLHLYSERLRGVIIENLDYRELLARYDKIDTVFYVDPPYLKSTRSRKHAYKHDWELKDHVELCEILKSVKGKVLVSGYYGEPYVSLGFREISFEARTQKQTKTEYVWASF